MLWRSATNLQLHSECGSVPPCKQCMHHQGQRVCKLHAKLRRRRVPSVSCEACRCTATLPNGTVSVAESPGRCKWHDDISSADASIESCVT